MARWCRRIPSLEEILARRSVTGLMLRRPGYGETGSLPAQPHTTSWAALAGARRRRRRAGPAACPTGNRTLYGLRISGTAAEPVRNRWPALLANPVIDACAGHLASGRLSREELHNAHTSTRRSSGNPSSFAADSVRERSGV